MNFREELNKIKESLEKDDSNLEKHVDFFIEGVCHALRQHKYIFNDNMRSDIFIAHEGLRIYAKYSESHVTELFELRNPKSKEIFDMLLQKLESEKFKVWNKKGHSFMTRLYD